MTYNVSYRIAESEYSFDMSDMDAVVMHIDALCKKHRKLIHTCIRPAGDLLRYTLVFD